MTFDVELYFNSRLKGHGQLWTGALDAECVEDALSEATTIAVRDPEHGRSICVTGCRIVQRKRS